MPVLFTCPHCSAQTLVDDCYIGASGPCVTCGKTITVPSDDRRLRTKPPRGQAGGPSNQSVRLVLVGFVITALIGGLFSWAFITLIWPELDRARRISVKQKLRNNLELIGTALRAYHAEHGSFPPAVVRDAAGRPMHSWRVLLLPYLGEEELYAAYSLSEPWDGPNNSLLLSSIPLPYRDPTNPEAVTSGETLFLAICGDGAAFPRSSRVALREITDGAGDTMMIAESAGSGVGWLEPADLQITRMDFVLNSGLAAKSISTHQGGGPLILLADGSVKELRPDTPETQVRGLVSIQGGETIHWNAITQ